MHQLTRGIAAAAFAALVGAAYGQDKIPVKVAYFGPPQHLMSQWLTSWGQKLEKASAGQNGVYLFSRLADGAGAGAL